MKRTTAEIEALLDPIMNLPVSVYCVQSTYTGHIKIGQAKNWRKRVSDVAKTGGHYLEVLLVVMAPKEAEREAHRIASSHRDVGEWFMPGSHTTAAIEWLKKTYPLAWDFEGHEII